MRDFTRLKVWQKAFDLAVRLEAAMPLRTGRGIPGLRAQTLRAAASISATICEGCGKESDAELLRYLDMSIGSAKELFNHMLMSRDVGLLARDAYPALEAQREEVIKMIYGFRRSVRNRAEPDA